ncbi:PA14 domain-containing protein, partial [Paraliobacillus sp. JSM ZJ581]|uniref:PA14 domain-containing protein n=1 Tax=Paraliobacillus sp. JSM ZJ581 TaxID=3342118 RepID=UPI0035A8578D
EAANVIKSSNLADTTDQASRYVTAKRLAAGNYVFRGKSTQNFDLVVDGKTYSFKKGKEQAVKVALSNSVKEDAHWIEIRSPKGGKVDLSIQKYNEVSNISSLDGWVGEVYNNLNYAGPAAIIGGKGAEDKIEKLDKKNSDWGLGSPSPLIRNDNFSAKFKRVYDIETPGYYTFTLKADTGAKVYLDGSKSPFMEQWTYSSKNQYGAVWLSKGEHEIEIEYRELKGAASLIFDMSVPDYTEKKQDIAYNWGMGGPTSKLTDYFTAIFDQSQTLNGDYFVQTMADNGIYVNANGKTIIDRWFYDASSSELANIDRALLLNQSGETIISTTYRESNNEAGIYSHVVPMGNWLTYRYDNSGLKGIPEAANVIKSSNLADTTDQASRYVTAKRLPAGEYVFRGESGQDFELVIDGKSYSYKRGTGQSRKIEIQDSNKNGNIHWIEVRAPKGGKPQMTIDRFTGVDNITASDGWVAELYDNSDFTGDSVIIGGKDGFQNITELNADWGDWGAGSPSPLINKDTFSGYFTRVYNVQESGYYAMSLQADTGAEVYLDGSKESIIDKWKYSNQEKYANVWLEKGQHIIKIKYHEQYGDAKLIFDFFKAKDHFKESKKVIRENWGDGIPRWDMIPDNFTIAYDQSQILKGNYFMQTFSDTGVKVNIDGKEVINKWDYETNKGHLSNISRTTLLNQSGLANIKTNYREVGGGAGVYSEVVKFDQWLAYYYSNDRFTGIPDSAKVFANSVLSDSNSKSGRYVTAKKIPEGKYVLRVKSSKDIQINIDDKAYNFPTGRENARVIDIKDTANDVHWLEVLAKGKGAINVYLQPYAQSMNISPSDGWVAEIFDNDNFSGNSVVVGGKGAFEKIYALNDDTSNWGTGSPSSLISPDNFSAKFNRVYNISESGYYVLEMDADTGARVYLNNKTEPVIDQWNYTSQVQYKRVYLHKGINKIEIEYRELSGSAKLLFDVNRATGPFYEYNSYNYDLETMIQKQLAASAQTDQHIGYIREDAFGKINGSYGTISGSGWRVRSGPNTTYGVIGSINNGTAVSILSKTNSKDSSGYYWYEIRYSAGKWINANASEIEFYVNPHNYSKNSTRFFQFLRLSSSAGLDVEEVNNKILTNSKGILSGRAQAFINAGKLHNINEIYLISHALLETGNGSSTLARGVKVNVFKDKNGKTDVKVLSSSATKYDAIVYNMYGIGAFDNDALHGGAKRAYLEGWTTPSKAIVGGASFVSKNYIHAGQDTLYKMRWNPDGIEKYGYATHQYATDIGWAVKQTKKIAELYSIIEKYTLVFEVPKFK